MSAPETIATKSVTTAPSGRTAAEAVQEADAKERLRDARAVRAAGIPMVFAGLCLLIRASVDASFSALLAILLIVLGPITYAVGAILLRRAIARTRANPVTAPILRKEE